jgi:hypothetical protein
MRVVKLASFSTKVPELVVHLAGSTAGGREWDGSDMMSAPAIPDTTSVPRPSSGERFGMIAAIMPCHRQPPITAGHPRAPSSGTHHTIGGTTPPIR